MADITITKVVCTANSVTRLVKFGEAADPGDAVYLDASGGNVWKKAINSSEAGAGGDGLAVCLTTVEIANDYGVICTGGTIRIDGATANTAYYVSPTAGGFAPVADVVAGDYVTVIGISGDSATTTYDEFVLQPLVSGGTV